MMSIIQMRKLGLRALAGNAGQTGTGKAGGKEGAMKTLPGLVL